MNQTTVVSGLIAALGLLLALSPLTFAVFPFWELSDAVECLLAGFDDERHCTDRQFLLTPAVVLGIFLLLGAYIVFPHEKG